MDAYTKLCFGLGEGFQEVLVPSKNLLGVLQAQSVPNRLAGEEEVRRAMTAPIGSPRLRNIVRPGERIAIVTSDITRPMPTWIVMPVLLDELYAAGVSRKDITLVFALGSHRPHTDEERRRLAGERAWNEIACLDSDPEDCVCLGVTAAGTPVDVTRTVAEADRRICLGNIEYHYFAGYSGGFKAIMPDISRRDAIQSNHSMMVLPEARAGNLEDNPVRRDIEDSLWCRFYSQCYPRRTQGDPSRCGRPSSESPSGRLYFPGYALSEETTPRSGHYFSQSRGDA